MTVVVVRLRKMKTEGTRKGELRKTEGRKDCKGGYELNIITVTASIR